VGALPRLDGCRSGVDAFSAADPTEAATIETNRKAAQMFFLVRSIFC
jgi:hypothetical protein